MFVAHSTYLLTGILFLLQTSIIIGQLNQRQTSFRWNFKLDFSQATRISCTNRNNSKLQFCPWTPIALKKGLFICSILEFSQPLCCYTSHQLWCCMQTCLCPGKSDKNIKTSTALLFLPFQKKTSILSTISWIPCNFSTR